jgi:hypothetical protein
MTTTHDESRWSRIVQWVYRSALGVASPLAILAGFSLVLVPSWDVLNPEMSLVTAKITSSMGGVAIMVVLGFGLLLVGILLRLKLINLRQRRNDRTAERVMSELRADPGASVAEFYLYLRAFETTGKLRVPLYLRLRKISLGLLQLVTNDLESYVSNAVRGVAPLIALGRPGEAIGAGRIVTEDKNWEADIVTLMKRAKGIFLVPSNRPGTLWEIDTLKREGLLLNRVIFIMPPRTKGALDTKERWEIAREVMGAHGLEAPEHQERGLLFEVGGDGKVSNVEPLLLNSVRQVRKSLQRLLSVAPPKGGLYKAITLADKRTRRATFWGWGETLRQLLPYPLAAAALFLDHPNIGFDPNESWATVFDRSATARTISEYGLSESTVLARSKPYLAIEARMPQQELEATKQGLIVRGLLRVDDDTVAAFFMAFGDMLARVDTQTCAAIARGELTSAELEIASTYIPSHRIRGFLHAKTAAIVAEAEDAPVPPLDEKAVSQATQQFLAGLGQDGQQRYERINQAQGELSDDDRCWLVRAMYGSVATLAEPHTKVWARTLAAMAIPTDDSTGREQAPKEATRQPPGR